MFPTSERTRHGIPVLSGKLPLLGHLLRTSGDQVQMLEDASRIHGPQFWMKLSEWLLMTTTPEAFDLLKNRSTTSAHYRDVVGEFVGVSLLGVDGPVHRRMRGSMNGPFTPKGITNSGAAEITADVIEERVHRFDGPSIAIHDETRSLALHIVFRVIGIAASDLEAWTAKYEQFLLTIFPIRLDVPYSPMRRGRLAAAWLDDRFRAILARTAKVASESGIVGALLEARDEAGQGLTEPELIDNLKLLALAGHETTASTMAWIVLELARRPELFDTLVAESIAAPGVPRSAKELDRHRFAEGLFREAVRLYPPVAMVSRRVTAPMRIGTYDAQVGDLLGVPLGYFGRDPARYPDPDRFDPSRWTERDTPITAIETSAFGGGPHFCLGYHFAWLETVQFAVAFARKMHERGVRPTLAPGTKLERRYRPFATPPRGIRVAFETAR